MISVLNPEGKRFFEMWGNMKNFHDNKEIKNYWFRRFKSEDFDVKDKECPGQLKKFEKIAGSRSISNIESIG